MYLAHIVAVSEQELHCLGMCELHWLADVDDPHFILEPKQVVLAQVAMDQGTLILHGIHYLQIESEDEVDFSSFSLFSVLVIINNVKILVTKRLYLKVFRILNHWPKYYTAGICYDISIWQSPLFEKTGIADRPPSEKKNIFIYLL